MSEEMDYDYFHHPEDIPGNDETHDEESEWDEALRQHYEEEDRYLW